MLIIHPPRTNDHSLDIHELRAWMETAQDLQLGDTSPFPVAREIHAAGFYRGFKTGLMLTGAVKKRIPLE
jgi:hypothetical protein